MSVDASGLIAKLTGAFALDLADRMGQEFLWSARGRAPKSRGDLGDSIQLESPRVSSDRIIVTCYTDSPYAGFQNRGTGEYVGEPRISSPRGPLSFFWAKAGGDVVFWSVKGTPATHFWDNTLSDWPAIIAAVAR